MTGVIGTEPLDAGGVHEEPAEALGAGGVHEEALGAGGVHEEALGAGGVHEEQEALFLESLGEPQALPAVTQDPVRPRTLPDLRELTLSEVRQRIAPLTLAGEQRLPVVASLTPWLPLGLQRGSTVEISGSGATSLLMRLTAEAMQQGSWMAVVGQPSLGWQAAEQQGVPLHQVVAVNTPPPGSWGQVMAALVDAFDLLLVSPQGVGSRDARRIEARARERGSVLLCLGQGWPRAADLQVRVELHRWAGLGWGHGHVSGCWAQVEVHGRGGQNHHVGNLLLAGAEPLEPTVFANSARFAGSDAAFLEPANQEQTNGSVVPFRQVG